MIAQAIMTVPIPPGAQVGDDLFGTTEATITWKDRTGATFRTMNLHRDPSENDYQWVIRVQSTWMRVRFDHDNLP